MLQGIAALMAMNILEEEEKVGGEDGWGSASHLHAGIEAMRLAFADALAYDADPEVDQLSLRSSSYSAFAPCLVTMKLKLKIKNLLY
jgi:gamma-glutamyltranspeptidase